MSAEPRSDGPSERADRRPELVVVGEPALRIEERRFVDNPYLPRQIVIRGPDLVDPADEDEPGLVEAWARATGQEPVGAARPDPRRRRLALFLLAVVALGSVSGLLASMPRSVDPAIVLAAIALAAVAGWVTRGRRRSV